MKKSRDEYWKILRVLVTNCCNYDCVYCHNEGQTAKNSQDMDYSAFLRLLECVHHPFLREIRFSGGEPLCHGRICELIEAASDCGYFDEIGVATNGSLISDHFLETCQKYGVSLTVHLPAVSEEHYHRITGGGFSQFKNALDRLSSTNLSFSFNFVLRKDTVDLLPGVLDYSDAMKRRLKIMPFADGHEWTREENSLIAHTRYMLDARYGKSCSNSAGVEVWCKDDRRVKLLNTPCRCRDIGACREYGEIRVLPDFRLQRCIWASPSRPLDLSDRDLVQRTMCEAWQDLNCPK